MPRDDLFQRIVDGDELALRDAFRAYGAVARDLARRIAGLAVADEVVEEVFLLIWSEPERWASAALDVHVLRITRDLSLAVRRRGVRPGLASVELEPFPIAPDAALPDIVDEINHEALQRHMLRLPGDQGRWLEDAWFEGRPAHEQALGSALNTLVDAMASGRLDRADT
ncbi:MAG: hypothetical protein OXH38_10005 [Chloroflexi bacterium]|nr:hypothetical protein [Chloroflexota bacterium]